MSKIKTQEINDGPLYVSWANAKDQNEAFTEMNKASEFFGGYSKANHFQDYSNLATNVSGRPGLNRRGYESFRPDESLPVKYEDIIRQADFVYQRVGLIRNIIDLMTDFACQGVRVVHPTRNVEKLHQHWFEKVGGKDRSERFLNHFYRYGNVIVRRRRGKIRSKDKKTLFTAHADDVDFERLDVKKSEIPLNYTFYDPLMVRAVGGPLSFLSGHPIFGIKLPHDLRRIINNPSTAEERAIVASLPADLKEAAKQSSFYILPPEDTLVYHYKKDDWRAWAFPMVNSIFKDIVMLEKLKLSDIAALDGAISNVRIFKLGNLEHKIAPTRAAASKLAETLESHTGAGTMDIIWGPDLEMQESKTTVHQFLGDAKYEPTLNAIYAGLGIPPTLTGTFGANGTTNNFISLKTLIKRLEYGRSMLKSFWDKELLMMQKAMGFRFPAKIEFDSMDLGDEAAERALWLQLADRNLISDELLQHKFGHDPEMEKTRILRQEKEYHSGRRVHTMGPFQQFGDEIMKAAVTTGIATPSEVGVELEERKSGEKSALELRQPVNPGGPAGSKPKGQPQQGRPKNSKDSTTRKKKRFTPKQKAAFHLWIKDAQRQVSEIITPHILDIHSKSSLRRLTANEQENAEIIKFGVLFNIEPFDEIDKESVKTALLSPLPSLAKLLYDEWTLEASSELHRKLTIDELRDVQSQVCIYMREDHE